MVPTQLERNFFPTGESALDAAERANAVAAQQRAERVATVEAFRNNTRARVASAVAAKRESKMIRHAALRDSVQAALLKITHTHDIVEPTPLQTEISKLEGGMQAASNTLLAFAENAPLSAHGDAPNSASNAVQSKVMARLRNPHAHQSAPKTPQGPFWTRGVSAEHAFSRAEEAQVVDAVKKWKMEEDRMRAHQVARARQPEPVTAAGVPLKLLQLPSHLAASAAEIDAAKENQAARVDNNRPHTPAATHAPNKNTTPRLPSARGVTVAPATTVKRASFAVAAATPVAARVAAAATPVAANATVTTASLSAQRPPRSSMQKRASWSAHAMLSPPGGAVSRVSTPYVSAAIAAAKAAAVAGASRIGGSSGGRDDDADADELGATTSRSHLFEQLTETESVYAQLEQRWLAQQQASSASSSSPIDVERSETARLAAHRRTHLRATARFRAAVRHKLIERMNALGVQMPPLCLCGLTVFSVDTSGCAQNCVFYRNPAAFQKAVEDIYASMTA